MKKNKVVEGRGKQVLEENDIDYLARFACLMVGVNVAADAAERLGMDPEKNNKWIKPMVFQKYIDERYEDMKFNIKRGVLEGRDDATYSW
mgnify:FL=1|jgi:hypothetical protein